MATERLTKAKIKEILEDSRSVVYNLEQRLEEKRVIRDSAIQEYRSAYAEIEGAKKAYAALEASLTGKVDQDATKTS